MVPIHCLKFWVTQIMRQRGGEFHPLEVFLSGVTAKNSKKVYRALDICAFYRYSFNYLLAAIVGLLSGFSSKEKENHGLD